ncbi:hypothetical protein [Diaphorobacter ruginosibacter]|uniref:DUF6916 family protein n=1 Tax=Diaphorobacter ruginosibacter TaxID=1715720 RepID=UPI0033426419
MPPVTETHLLDDALWSRVLTHDIAAALQGQVLQCYWGDEQGRTQSVPLRLGALRERPAHQQHQQFSVFFQGPASPQLPQRTYRMRHAELGDFAVFIAPVARTSEGLEYEACVSHDSHGG